jgi:transforming growth factor-beta-induced protein
MNMKKIMSYMKYTLPVAVVFSLALISGCGSSDDSGPTKFSGSIMDLIQSDDYKQAKGASADVALDSLVKYLNKNADLVAVLNGSSNYTLFAPSNTAFINLLATPGFPANIEDINPNVIKGVLAYHIVAGTKMKADLTTTGAGPGINTLYSDVNPCTGASTVQVIKINENGTILTGSTNTAIEFQKADVEASNGVVHVVKTVLIPPSVGASLTPILGTLAGTVLLANDFSDLAKFIMKADCGITGEETPIANILANPEGSYTAFLPTNAVFDGTAATLLGEGKDADDLLANFTAAQCRQIVLTHIGAGTYEIADLTAETSINTLLGGTLTVSTTTPSASVPLGILLTTGGTDTGLGGTSSVPVYPFDAEGHGDIPASNGVAHIVVKVLFPN